MRPGIETSLSELPRIEAAFRFSCQENRELMEHSQRSRRFNVVVYGATGYTGQFVSEELYRLQNNGRSDLKWAAAGRNRTKLENVLKGRSKPLKSNLLSDSYMQQLISPH